MDKQVVIARYKEDVGWVSGLKTDYIIYDKSGEDSVLNDHIIKIPNEPLYGCEAHTYLLHIINNYNNLYDQIIFVQGNPYDHCPKILELINEDWDGYFRGLGRLCVCLSNYWFPKECFEHYKKTFKRDFPIKNWHISGAQIQVTKEIVLSNPIEFYQGFYDLLVSQNNKQTAIFMELIWKDIFLHKHPHVFKKFITECTEHERYLSHRN